jgi:hypothetical protein
MQYETIELKAALVDRPGYSALLIDYALEINGIEFHPEHQLDLTSLVKSCQWSGELDIFTCSCGEPGCAGIFQGIEVEHTQDAITWRCPKPLSVSEDTPDLWEHGVTTFEHFTFVPDQYIDAIDLGIKRIKSLAVSAQRPVDFPVHGVEFEQVVALETRPFSIHTMVPERRVVARQLIVGPYHGMVSLDGVDYQMSDLDLTEELMAQYSAWSKSRVLPDHEANVGSYLTYLQAGRLFCRALRKYIGRRTVVKFRYHPPDVYNSGAWEVTEIIR